ncbi:MAG: hypothetical protein KKD29_07870 [Candidatus Omnitrophica bacterium]|nr:hypothetical protein [Candidatus Omnitrophota bacterium]MBU4488213.1 hypothetical protein [Candidatus Omnitrophota bacterium]MCG2705384.1 hypothetical protein [Candidatus Omnitrophota bacterium]
MKLVDEIKAALEPEVRTSSDANEYFEAVFMVKDLEKLNTILEKEFGKPLKPPAKNVKFTKEVQNVVDLIGGLRREQSFYAKNETESKYFYAALWPWQSDPSKITLKMGLYDINKLTEKKDG